MSAACLPSLAGPAADVAWQNVRALLSRSQQAVDLTAGAEPIRSVGVVGAGVMGIGIAAAHLTCGLPVTVSDAAPEALARSQPAILEEAAWLAAEEAGGPAERADDLRAFLPTPGALVSLPRVAAPRVSPEQTADRQRAFAPLLTAADGDDRLAACALVLESVVENAAVKRRIYQRLEPKLRPSALLASNTSTLPISGLAQGLQHPARFCGLHFLHPVRCRRLVEVVRGRDTSPATIAAALQHLKRIGKLPIVVGDGPGFLVNRLLFPHVNEALELLLEGVAIQDIDQAATAFGMPLGPLALCDLIGLDTSLNAGRVMWEAFPDRVGVSPVLPALVKRGRLGRKAGRGFYRYADPESPPTPDPDAAQVIETYVRQRRAASAEEIATRLFLSMALEATRVLDEGLVGDARDVDAGLIFGLGFPAARGGLLFWADHLGPAGVVERLEPLARRYARFQPTPRLQRLVRDGTRFYAV